MHIKVNIVLQNAFQLQTQNNFLNPHLKIYFKAILSNYMNINTYIHTYIHKTQLSLNTNWFSTDFVPGNASIARLNLDIINYLPIIIYNKNIIC